MTKEELDFIGSMNICDEISNEAYKKIVCHCEDQQPCEDAVSRQAVHDLSAELLSDYLHDEDREKIEELDVKIEDLPPVTPKENSEYEHDHEVIKAYNAIRPKFNIYRDGQAYILNKIRAKVEEIKLDVDLDIGNEMIYNNAIKDVLQIIDKYRGE